MASKENQSALNNLVYFADPFDRDEFNRVERWKNTLQKAIDDLELYEKEKEIAKRIFNDPDLCYGEEKEFLEYIEEMARKEIENEKAQTNEDS